MRFLTSLFTYAFVSVLAVLAAYITVETLQLRGPDLSAYVDGGDAEVSTVSVTDQPTPDTAASTAQVRRNTITTADVASTKTGVISGQWPPRKGDTYPELILKDQNGNPVRLRDFKGKPILIELVAISCQGCQAFAGGNQFGGFMNVQPQKNLESIHKYAKQYANVRLGESSDVVFIQLIVYGKKLKAPPTVEVRDWANHFKMPRSNQCIVLQGEQSMISAATFHMIPGFHLIDRDFALASDTTKGGAKDDLYKELLPTLKTMMLKTMTR